MKYTVKEVADIAGVSRRTLHYYDQIDLLKPSKIGENGYRFYEEGAILRLQQILFYRELDFSLNDIREMMKRPDYDILESMTAHRAALQNRVGRLKKLINTLDQTILHLNGELNMTTDDLFDGFDEETQEAYAEEAAQRWDPERVKASNRRWKNYSTEKQRQVMEESKQINLDLLAHMNEGHDSESVQAVVGRWYNHISHFYEPTLAIFRGLGRSYEEDPAFAAFYQKLHPDMPAFFRQAIDFYCDEREK